MNECYNKSELVCCCKKECTCFRKVEKKEYKREKCCVCCCCCGEPRRKECCCEEPRCKACCCCVEFKKPEKKECKCECECKCDSFDHKDCGTFEDHFGEHKDDFNDKYKDDKNCHR